MEEIKDRFSAKAIAAGLEIKELIKEHGDKKIGVITCGMYSPLTGKSVAIARVDVDYAVQGRPIQVKGSLEVNAITHTLPFDDPQKLKRTAKG